jgi:hypothetical protein
MKKIAPLFLLTLFCLAAGRTWYWATDGFRLARIKSFNGFEKEREFSKEAEQALAQRYFYLGRGRQCFAFQSADGKYVVKFPRTDRYKSRLWLDCFFLDFLKVGADRTRNNIVTRKKKLFKSFEISYDELREDTALVALFNASKQERQIEIVDRLGRVFRLPLASTEFILQRKMRLFKDVFQDALAKKNEQEIEKILDQLLEVVVRIANKGILSKDGSFLNNFGFDGTRAYQIDIGSFYRNEELSAEEAFVRSIHASVEKLRIWLLHLNPSLLTLIDRKLHLIYEKKNDISHLNP